MSAPITYNGLTLSPENGYNVRMADGYNGLPVRISEANLTARPGGNVYARQHGMRTITIEGRVWGSTIDEFFDRKNALLDAFNAYTESELVTTLWNGETRSIEAKTVEEPMIIYMGGEVTYAPFRVVLRCSNPYWKEAEAITAILTLPTIIGFDFPFDFPFDIESDTSTSEVIINNVGDVTAYPKFVITGDTDLQNPTITNLTTGKFVQIATTVDAGQTVTIEFTGSGESITRENGANYYQYKIGEVFPLELGNNVLQFTATSYVPNASVYVEFYPRYQKF